MAKKITILLQFLLFGFALTAQVPFSGISGNFITDSKFPVVSLLSPSGGESFFAEDMIPVTWSAADDSFGANPISISISTNGGLLYEEVMSGLPNSGTVDITAPKIVSSQVKIKVTAQDQFGLVSSDESDAVFSLTGVLVVIKAYLEGPFAETEMSTNLNSQNLVPLSQPYNQAPWNYSGTESVPSLPNPDIVDWVLLEIRETAGDASTAYTDNAIGRKAGFLIKNGDITGTDGDTVLLFHASATSNLFAVVYQRNHIPVLSSDPLTLNGQSYRWDFRSGAQKAFGGSDAHKLLSSGKWGLTAGDGDASGEIDATDKTVVWSVDAGESGYLGGDYNLNGEVNNPDKNDFWLINIGRTSHVTGAWSCGLPVIDPRDGQPYPTVLIGAQCWMAKNLNVGNMITGTTAMTNNGVLEKYCYDDNSSNCDDYGGLYQWVELMNYTLTPGTAGLCPPVAGWHMPTDPEMYLLSTYLGGESVAGGKLKEAGTAHWTDPNTGATNESGFTALPGGLFYSATSVFNGLHTANYLATSSEFDGIRSVDRRLSHTAASVIHSASFKNDGLSVRCVKGEYVNQPPFQPTNPTPVDGSSNQYYLIDLSWTGFDPDNDPMTYDVYYGTTNPPSLLASGVLNSSYSPGVMSFNTTYYWKIVVHDDHANSTEGPVWSFTTQCQLPPNAGPDQINIPGVTTYLQGNTPTMGTGTWYIASGTGGIIGQPNNPTTLFTGIAGNAYVLYWVFNDPCGTVNDYVNISFSSTFSCGYTFLDARDNKVYNTVQIGSQCWMKENLNYATGTSACYGGNPANCDNYGRLYDYNSVSTACPTGWHLPNDVEWCTLTTFIDPTVNCAATGISGTDAGNKMKETGTTFWLPPNNGATNSSGFSARGGGSSFSALMSRACFWSTTDYSGGKWSWELFYNDARIARNVYGTSNQLSVRCIKN